MIALATRRWFAGAATIMATAVIAAVFIASSLSLHNTAHRSGWLLLSMLAFLALYNLRKKLTYPPLFQSSTWLQIHIYVGVASIVIFLLHTGLRVPNGAFEIALASLFAAVAGSGVIGLGLSRVIPFRLTVRGEEVIFERIGAYRRQVRQRAEELIVGSVRETDVSTLANFYTGRLAWYFAKPRHLWRHLLQSQQIRHHLSAELRALERYLNAQERLIAAELAELIDVKDNLDYHLAMQGMLKGWLFVHIPLTYALLLFAAVHVMLVHAFAESAR